MDEHIRGALFGQPNSPLVAPYLRGLTVVIQQQRVDYILARTRRCQRRRGRLLASSVVWLNIAMSLFATYSIPMVWRSLHSYCPDFDPDESTFTKARQRLGVAPMRELFREIAPNLAASGTPGVFYRSWRLMGIDGTTFDMPDTPDSGVGRADSGGVKFDRVLPKPKVAGVDAKGGYGNVPFHRTEFTAKTIRAFFSIDLAQIRGYGLADDPTKLLIALSLWKVRKFLDSNMRLRAACELELACGEKSVNIKRPDSFVLPSVVELTKELGELIEKSKPHFANPSVTELTWNNPKG